MGMTLMADDVERLRTEVAGIRDNVTALNRSMGKVEGVVEGIASHLVRQDTDAREDRDKRDRDKAEAIAARAAKELRDDQKHAENTTRLETMDRKLTTTFGLSSANEKWITERGMQAVEWVEQFGKPSVELVGKIDARVSAIEGKRRDEKAEERGSIKTWALIGTLVTGGLSAIGALLAYRDQIMDFLRGH